tara:strand:+ start:93 stop:584 length:492 start_codon:yes stop_codon:yes gene_type:complete
LIDLKRKKNKILQKENFYFTTIILATFFLDRFTKNIIISDFSESSYYVNDFLNFDLIWNTGIGFGLLSFNSNLYYNLITFLILVVIIFLVIISLKSDNYDKIIFSIIIGGALGNFYDRIIFKAVPDFIDLHYKSFHWFTFNIADIFITVGLVLVLLSRKKNNE